MQTSYCGIPDQARGIAMKSVIIGDKELKVSLDKIANIDLRPALAKVGNDIETQAKQNCTQFSHPTGALKRSIQTEVDHNSVEVGTNLDYAVYVEYGTGLFAEGGKGRADTPEHPIPWRYRGSDGLWYTTSGQKPQPYLIPAFNSKKDNFYKYLKEELDKLW